MDSAVGPGVGSRVITVHPESGKNVDSVGTESTTVGAGRGSLVAPELIALVEVGKAGTAADGEGVACSLGRQPARPTATSIKIRNNFFIHFSMGKCQAILPVKV
jgi:hypothetical protein